MNFDHNRLLCSRILALLPNIKFGTLRIWGNWFGKPYDNQHGIIGCKVVDDQIVIEFREGETLQVWGTGNFHVSSAKFEIQQADRVRWNWYLYGRPSTRENYCYLDYFWHENKIKLLTNFDLMTQDAAWDVKGNAVELL